MVIGRYSTQQLVALGILVLAAMFLVFLNAWSSDDAYITFRVIDNALGGHGLRWNIAERVQVYTHPLWMLANLVIAAATQNVAMGSLLLSIACTAIALIFGAFRIARTYTAAIFVIVAASFSRAFVDFATSGLENPLGYLLIAVFILMLLRPVTHKDFLWLTLIGSLTILVRYDVFLLVLPALIMVFFRLNSWRAVWYGIAGLTPAITWEIFALVYYGFFLPNTAYAKLVLDLPRAQVTTQGLRYMKENMEFDAMTVGVIAIAILLLAVARSWKSRALAYGLVAYMGYVVTIGGDFMLGRFLAVPFFFAVIGIGAYWPKQRITAASLILLALSGILGKSPTIFSPKPGMSAISASGIADERRVYFDWTSLMKNNSQNLSDHPWARTGASYGEVGGVFDHRNIGILGYFAGPGVHIIDRMALSDPLLARIPRLTSRQTQHSQKTPWRIGHFERDLPPGYLDAVKTGDANAMPDENLAQYYEQLTLITSGPIWSKERWRAILEMQLKPAPRGS